MNRTRRYFKVTFIGFLLFLFSAVWLQADGLIVIPRPPIWPPPHPLPRPVPPPQSPFPLDVRYHRVSVSIKNQAATTTIDQAFYNPTDNQLEGFYLFPLPEGASIKSFSMELDGKVVTAELLDAAKAREIYQDIVRRMRDPALLEYAGQGTFKLRIFPIEPRSEKHIRISYGELLRSEAGLFTYRYPLNTEKFSARPIDEVRLKIEIETDQKIKTLFSPSHQVEIEKKDDYQAKVTYQAKKVKPDTDFLLTVGLENAPVGLHLLTHKEPGEDGYFLLTASPGIDSQTKLQLPKDLLLVVDTSGSMAGKKMEQLKRALLYCLENLSPQDRLNIIRFSTEVEPLWSSLQLATRSNVEKAKQAVEEFRASGGTNIEQALTQAVQAKDSKERPCLILFFTDGQPTIGETNPDKILEKVKHTNTAQLRIFTFGLGHDVNTHLLDRLTELTRAERLYVQPEEDLEIKISSFYEKIKSPVLTDVKVDFGPLRVNSLYPVQLPDLFAGSQMIILGRYQGQGQISVTLSGKTDKEKREFKRNFDFPAENPGNKFIPSLWAAKRIGYLLDQIRLSGDEKELKEEIIALAKRYGIITPYTSYLIVEDERVQILRGAMRKEDATLSAVSLTDPYLEKRMAADYQGLSQNTGRGSVQASQEVQTLKQATSFSGIAPGKERLSYVDSQGQTQNLAQAVRYIEGRAFYQVNGTWVDSRLQSAKEWPVKRIQFASEEYFALLRKEPELGQILSLGQTVRFAHKSKVYEICE
ncbi:MAG: VIT and VWA domain-containing protein [Candidatus Omnitrophica bacterium]|nr:VIT and VWA domain-containing protein [Candidatus Omnitrophota bacterium]